MNQYTAVGGVNYSYDKNGNLTDDGTHKYYYDCENHLIEVNDVNDSPVVSYRYDFAGRRVRKTDYTLNPVRYTRYYYYGDQIVAEANAISGQILRRFVYGPGIDEPICMRRYAAGGGTGWFYYHYDGLGSVVAISDANGKVVEKYSYDVFGEAIIRDSCDVPRDSSAYGNPYLFTGREFDAETGNYYYRARYYSPEIGRFLQPDPIGYTAGVNLYTYCGNNPVNWIDPFGERRRLGKNFIAKTGIHDRKSCLKYCKETRNENLATAKWAYKRTNEWVEDMRNNCRDACDEIAPPGKCPEEDPLDRNEACKALCELAAGEATTVVYVEYGIVRTTMWGQYGSCTASCYAFWKR